ELDMVLAVAGIGFCRLSDEARVVAASSQFRCEFGLSPDSDADWIDFEARVHAEDRAELATAVANAFESESGLDILVRATWGDGLPRWVVLHGRVAVGAQGQRELLLVSRNATKEQLTIAALAGDAQRER